MINIVLSVIITILYSIITYPIRIFNNFKEKEEKEKANYILLRPLIKCLFFITRIKIIVNGEEHIDNSENYSIICNHKSNLDSILLISIFKKPIIFIGKKEINKVPLLSQWFTDIGSLFMDRDNIRQSATTISQGINTLKNGKSVVIFPEGKRIQEDKIGEFMNGSFKLANKSGANILPIAIIGSHTALSPNKLFTSGKIKVNIGKPINWNERKLLKTNEMSEYTNEIIKDLYSQK